MYCGTTLLGLEGTHYRQIISFRSSRPSISFQALYHTKPLQSQRYSPNSSIPNFPHCISYYSGSSNHMIVACGVWQGSVTRRKTRPVFRWVKTLGAIEASLVAVGQSEISFGKLFYPSFLIEPATLGSVKQACLGSVIRCFADVGPLGVDGRAQGLFLVVDSILVLRPI